MKEVSRRTFVGGMGVLFAMGATAVAAGCAPQSNSSTNETPSSEVSSQAEITPDETIDCDIAIVGAGCSGLAACVQAADEGAHVVCVDYQNVTGGASGGVEGVFAVNSGMQKDQGIEVSMGELIRTELEQNQYRNSGLVLRDLVHASGEDIDWLLTKGVRFGKVDNYVGYHPIFHWFETGTGAESYVVPMNQAALDAGVEFILDTHADQLIQADDGSIVGLYATKGDGTVLQVNAQAVILASGGFADRLDLLAQFGYNEENSLPSTMGCDGSGHDMAIAVGGASNASNMGMLGGASIPDLPSFFEGGYFCSVMNAFYDIPSMIWVNENGERFVNEDLALANHMVVANPVRMHKHVYIILDAAKMDEYVNGDEEGLKELSDGQAKGVIIKAGSWAELAKAIGADPDVLQETVDSYNTYCSIKDDSEFGKDPDYLIPMADDGDVYAVEVKNSIGKTMGSIKTDRNFSVLNDDDEPIDGLYAVGVEGAMIWANVYTMNISGSCAAHNVYSGRTAAKHAVQTRVKA